MPKNGIIQRFHNSRTDRNGVIGVPSVAYARALNIAGLGTGYFDIPNMYELAVIYAESDNIDAMDKSALANPGRMLGKGGTNGRFYFTGTSTDFIAFSLSKDKARVCGVNSQGSMNYPYKSNKFGVLPARAIDA